MKIEELTDDDNTRNDATQRQEEGEARDADVLVGANKEEDNYNPPASAAGLSSRLEELKITDEKDAKQSVYETATTVPPPPRLGRIGHQGLLLLSSHVFSKSILDFLDRPSLFQLFRVAEMKEHFRLGEYYHDSSLEQDF